MFLVLVSLRELQTVFVILYYVHSDHNNVFVADMLLNKSSHHQKGPLVLERIQGVKMKIIYMATPRRPFE